MPGICWCRLSDFHLLAFQITLPSSHVIQTSTPLWPPHVLLGILMSCRTSQGAVSEAAKVALANAFAKLGRVVLPLRPSPCQLAIVFRTIFLVQPFRPLCEGAARSPGITPTPPPCH